VASSEVPKVINGLRVYPIVTGGSGVGVQPEIAWSVPDLDIDVIGFGAIGLTVLHTLHRK
jgi:hypothetical protein